MTKTSLLVMTLLAIAAYADSTYHLPLFAWSGHSSLINTGGKNMAINEVYDEQNINQLFEAIFSKQENSLLNPGASIVVLFVEPELRSDEVTSSFHSTHGPFSKVYQSVESSPSVTIPLVKGSFMTETLVNVVSKQSGSITYIGEKSELFTALGDHIDDLATSDISILEDENTYKTGETNIVIVYLGGDYENHYEKFSESDKVIRSVNSIVSKFTTEYINVYTALSATIPDTNSMDSFLEKRSVFEISNSSGVFPFSLYFPGVFFDSFFTVLILALIAIFGVCSVLDIQTPDRFIG
eukprot:TRINITY_DN12349_c0_g1_i1.p1 TRINITY_DN12349_c0_g1~~TRINITY_DN12349_c0_g1_i1.p1  ORF type:complete len:319 (+),score=59.56 TRINITY_DN12349_c0_g1_i1:72-959(+)